MRSMPPNKCRKIYQPVQFTGLSLILAILLLFAACSFAQTEAFPCDKGLLPINMGPRFLPDESSEVFKALVLKIKNDFEKTKSFSTFNFASLIPPQIVEELKMAMNQHQAMCLQTGVVRLSDPLGVPFYTDYKDQRLNTFVETSVLMKVEAILSWFEKLIVNAFPQLVLQVATSQLRITKERGNGHSGLRVWHPDGGVINVFIPFDGPGPEYSTEPYCPPSQFVETEKTIQGQAIVFAGTDIEKINQDYFSCIHRSPRWNGKRFVMVMHFYLRLD